MSDSMIERVARAILLRSYTQRTVDAIMAGDMVGREDAIADARAAIEAYEKGLAEQGRVTISQELLEHYGIYTELALETPQKPAEEKAHGAHQS